MEDKGIQGDLERDARIIKERIPMDMTKASADKVAESLRLFMNENGYSNADVARSLDISESIISQIKNGKYHHNLEIYINKIVNLINSEDRKGRRPRGPKYVETTIAMKIGALISHTDAMSDEEGAIAVIIGDSGSGKTKCLQAYSEANRNSIYVQLDKTMYSTMIFAAIAKKLHLDESGSLAMISQRLVEKLQNMHIIIMLDEGSSLSVSQLDLLRQIIVVKSRCPLILAGNGDLLKTILLPTAKRGFESLDQFRSRLTSILDLNALAGNKSGGLYTAEDIRKLYQYGGIRLTDDAVTLLRKICSTPESGRMRTCHRIIVSMHTSSKIIAVGKIDAEQILTAIKQLNLPNKARLPVTFEEVEPEQTQAGAKVA